MIDTASNSSSILQSYKNKFISVKGMMDGKRTR